MYLFGLSFCGCCCCWIFECESLQKFNLIVCNIIEGAAANRCPCTQKQTKYTKLGNEKHIVWLWLADVQYLFYIVVRATWYFLLAFLCLVEYYIQYMVLCTWVNTYKCFVCVLGWLLHWTHTTYFVSFASKCLIGADAGFFFSFSFFLFHSTSSSSACTFSTIICSFFFFIWFESHSTHWFACAHHLSSRSRENMRAENLIFFLVFFVVVFSRWCIHTYY